MRRAWFPLVPFGMLLAGCGGGGSTLTSGPDPETRVGPMNVEGSVETLAPTVTPGGATLYAVSGSVNGAKMTDANPTVDETEVFFASDRASGIGIMACSPDGRGLRFVTATSYVQSIKVVGGFVYYVETPDAVVYSLMRVKASGGSPTTVKSNISQFAFNLAQDKIYGYQLPSASWPNGRLMSFNTDGTATSHMFATDFALSSNDFLAGVTSDGSILLVDLQSPSFSAYKTFSPGGSPRGATSFAAGAECVGMENGTDVFYQRVASVFERVFVGSTGIWPREVVGVANRYDNRVAVSPGGTHFAFSNDHTATGIYVHEPGNVAGLKVYGQRGRAVAWGPFITQRDFFAGLGFSSAGAMLFSERGPVLPAVVWADATTRNSITLTKVSADGGQNVVYRLNCDQLTRLAYSNSLNYTPVDVAGATESGVRGAFISFNAESGKVETLTTFKGTVNATQKDEGLLVSGADTVYRADGKVERAPGVLVFK